MMRRRDVIAGLGFGTLIWLPSARSQPGTQMPVIAVLHSASLASYAPMLAALREGLSEAGYVEDRNVAIEFRLAEGHYERLPALAAELVSHKVAVIVATGSVAPAMAAKTATTEIPIVFISGSDPVRTGLVPSLNRPGGNVTGISIIFTSLVPKRLELLHLLVPDVMRIGAVVNPNYPEADFQQRELKEAATAIGKPIHIVSAGTVDEIEAAFAELSHREIGALLVANDPFFVSRGAQFAALAARYAMPAIYSDRTYTESGGLMSYGPSLAEAFRQAGIYTARILGGAKPADLPVMQPTKFELVINLKTAKALGLVVPSLLLAEANEVVE